MPNVSWHDELGKSLNDKHGCSCLRLVEGSRLPIHCKGNPLGWRAAWGILSSRLRELIIFNQKPGSTRLVRINAER
jgi:hypothetical protein